MHIYTLKENVSLTLKSFWNISIYSHFKNWMVEIGTKTG
jgi:hypothetical protein